MKTIWRISVYALLLMGMLHVGCTPLYYHQFNVDAVWFASCGFMLVFQAFLNILAWQMQEKSGYLIALISNLISLLLVVALFWIQGEIQTVIGMLLAAVIVVCSLHFWNKA